MCCNHRTYASPHVFGCIFFFNHTATTEIYTLSLHDALPISRRPPSCGATCATSSSAPARRRPSDRKSTRLNSSHVAISYAVFCLKKKNIRPIQLVPRVHKEPNVLCLRDRLLHFRHRFVRGRA